MTDGFGRMWNLSSCYLPGSYGKKHKKLQNRIEDVRKEI
jgi:hypothetical protein